MTDAKKPSPATTHPRFSYRTELAYKNDIDQRIKKLLAKSKKFSWDEEGYKTPNQNMIFLEIIYRGLDALEEMELSPDNPDGYYKLKEDKEAA